MPSTFCISKTVPGFLDVIPFPSLDIAIFVVLQLNDYFFNWQTEKEKLLWTNKKSVLFFNCSNWEKFVDKIREKDRWKHMMNLLFMYLAMKMCCVTLKKITLRVRFRKTHGHFEYIIRWFPFFQGMLRESDKDFLQNRLQTGR